MFKDGITYVCFLKKTLYGLNQSFWLWYQTFLNFHYKFNFYKTKANHDLFISTEKMMFNAVYVNYWLLSSANMDPWIDNILQNFWDKFGITDLGDVSH